MSRDTLREQKNIEIQKYSFLGNNGTNYFRGNVKRQLSWEDFLDSFVICYLFLFSFVFDIRCIHYRKNSCTEFSKDYLKC